MQRWFYATEELICDHSQLEHETGAAEPEVKVKPQLRSCRFCVKICDRELLPNEAIAISGDCEQLGNWQLESCILMSPILDGCQDKWHARIKIPADKVVSYRYLIVAIDPENKQLIVRFFESHLRPRKVKPQNECKLDVCEDVFGVIKSCVKVERGWLTTERIVQLMFFKEPFKWCEDNLRDHILQVKVTPAHRKALESCPEPEEYTSKPICPVHKAKIQEHKAKVTTKTKVSNECKCPKMVPSYTKLNLQDCKDMFPEKQNHIQKENPAETDNNNVGHHVQVQTPANKPNVALSTAFAFNEVVNFSKKGDTLKQQPTFGTPCSEQDLTMFHLTIGDFYNTVYLIEIFTYSKHAAPDESPYLVGYRYLLPEDLEPVSSGYIEAPIVCASKHRMIGKMQFRFLVIRPAENIKFDLSTSYLRHWSPRQKILDVGHRGQGVTYQTVDGSFVYENTVQSIQMAVENGGDMVEFDVQLTKDAVPVIWHDLNVQVAQSNPKILQDFNSINIPLSKFSYKQLRKIKLPGNVKLQPPKSPQIGGGDIARLQQLFPLLDDIMDACDDDIAYDIEIKWPQQFCNGKWEQDVKPCFDRNFYIDRILQVVMTKARNRRVVFSSFDADMCSMLRFKQNLFPVMFLLSDHSYKPYLDARSNLETTAINFAYGTEFLGLIPHANTLRDDPNVVLESQKMHLIVFCYGVSGDEDTTPLKDIGVSAVILDRMDKLSKRNECNCSCCPSLDFEDNTRAGGDSRSFKSLKSWNSD